MLIKSLKQPSYRKRLRERFGYSPILSQDGVIWFHAVSVGEVIVAAPLLEQLLGALPDVRLLVTTTTPMGSEEVQRRFGNRVAHCYMPYDAMRCIRRFVRRTNPRTLFLVETELWPNTLRTAHRHGIPVCLLNARLSERSAKRYSRIRKTTAQMIGALHQIVCQYQDTADRFITLGATLEQIQVIGSVKFDLTMSDELREASATLKNAWCPDRLCWIAGSTHPSEEEVVLNAHRLAKRQYSDLLLVLAPRHTYRSQSISTLARDLGFSTATLSESARTVDVLVADQMGTLVQLYGVADVAFIGGSLQGTGGHNPVEPAIHGLPMLMGPDRMNFEFVSEQFVAGSCLTTVQNATELATKLTHLLADPDERARQGQAAQQVVLTNQGATTQQFEIVRKLIADATQ